jgi:hypothetical protein
MRSKWDGRKPNSPIQLTDHSPSTYHGREGLTGGTVPLTLNGRNRPCPSPVSLEVERW